MLEKFEIVEILDSKGGKQRRIRPLSRDSRQFTIGGKMITHLTLISDELF